MSGESISADRAVASSSALSPRRLILPLALAQLIRSFAGSNMNVMIQRHQSRPGHGGLGAAAGPLIGGLITTAISWRAAFVFQALVIMVIVLLGRGITDPLPPDPDPAVRRSRRAGRRRDWGDRRLRVGDGLGCAVRPEIGLGAALLLPRTPSNA